MIEKVLAVLALVLMVVAVGVLLTLLGHWSGLPRTYYVATDGDDGADGSLGTPFLTIQHAAGLAQAGDTVVIRAGTYRETVTPAHSGTAGARITFQPYPGEAVTVSGADPVTGWSADRGSIYRTSGMGWDLGAGNNQIFVDGQAMVEARWPNTSVSDLSHPTWATSQGSDPACAGSCTITDPALTDTFWAGGTIHVMTSTGWVASALAVTGSTPGSVTYSDPDGTDTPSPDGTGDAGSRRYWLTGKLQALDSAGEWFRDASFLFLWAPAGDDPGGHTVEAKVRFYAFDLSGRNYITVQGLSLFAAGIQTDASSSHDVFDGITATYPSQFYSPIGWEPPQSPGILLAGSGHVLQNCTISNSAASGVVLQGTHQTVTNCVIHDFNYWASDHAGVYFNSELAFHSSNQWGSPYLGPNSDHVVSRNTIYNGGRVGVIHRTAPGAKILYNDLFNLGLQSQDMGCTYTLSNDGGGTEIAYNWCHDNPVIDFSYRLGHGFHIDGPNQNYLIHHNVAWNTSPHGVGSGLSVSDTSAGIHIYHNTFVGTPGATSIELRDCPTDCEAYNNLTDGAVSGSADEQNNLQTADPRFVDVAGRNFQLRADSPARDYGRVIPGITDGYVGGAPDAGAYEYGAAAWRPGIGLVGKFPHSPGFSGDVSILPEYSCSFNTVPSSCLIRANDI